MTGSGRGGVFAILELEDSVQDAVAALGGECIGHDIGAGDAVLYVHGSAADALTYAIPIAVVSSRSNVNAYAIKRYGSEDDETAREERVPLA